MAAVVNGMALHGGVIKPYGSTFLVFSDYMRPALRLAALMRLPVVWVWTHDSIAIGPDGPTHQPVEHLASLRSMPGMWLLRPCDANETAAAWRICLARSDGPVALVLARQALPTLHETAQHIDGPARGGYVLWESRERPRIVLLATGSEVHIALSAAKLLSGKDIAARVVSLPCWELFEKQDKAYQDAVLLPGSHPRLAVEAASPLGWHQWIGSAGRVCGLREFGASADGDTLLKHFRFTAKEVALEACRLLADTGDHQVPGREEVLIERQDPAQLWGGAHD
jgi:transketolase